MMASVRSIFWRLYRSAELDCEPAELTALDRGHRSRRDPDFHYGAVEGDRPGDQQNWNHNAPAIDERGLPGDPVAIAQDVVGAGEDDTEG